MTHWKKLMDPKDMLYAYDLDGKDVTVEIVKVIGGELTGEQGRKTKKPIAQLKGTPKKLALNNTNCATIEQLTGSSQYEDWTGVRVVLFPTTTSFGGKTVECIRIRPYPPKDKANGNGKSRAAAKPSADDDIPDVTPGLTGSYKDERRERVAAIEAELTDEQKRALSPADAEDADDAGTGAADA